LEFIPSQIINFANFFSSAAADLTEKAGRKATKSDMTQAPGVGCFLSFIVDPKKVTTNRGPPLHRRTMTQKQREAVVDLLLLGMFADGSLKASQDQKLLSVISQIGWQSYQTLDLYLQSAIAKARDASETEEGTRFRLRKIGESLETQELRQRALDYLADFLALDGKAGTEAGFFQLAKANVGGS
jgi:hypothetical protein